MSTPESGHLFSLSGIGAEHSAPPRGSDFYLFGDGEGIINLNAKVAHGALMGDLNLALWAAFKIKLEKTKKEMSQLRACPQRLLDPDCGCQPAN